MNYEFIYEYLIIVQTKLNTRRKIYNIFIYIFYIKYTKHIEYKKYKLIIIY